MARVVFSFLVLWLIVKGMEAAVEVRLVDGKTPHDGCVEVRINNGPWKMMSNRYWNLRNAYVVCRMLNYTRAVSTGTAKVNGSFPIYPKYPACYGHEASIELCGQHDVTFDDHTSQVASVVCGNRLTPEEKAIKVRLVGTNVSHVGQVEIQYNGSWGAVCGKHYSGWDIRDAHVICRMLGYKGAFTRIWRIEGDSSTKLLLNDVGCTGKERSIAECAHSGWGNVWSLCTYRDLAGVVCQTDEDPPPLQVRLAGGKTPNSGRVEVRYHGVWGTIGSLGWSFKDALIICHMLGYPILQSHNLYKKFGYVRGISWLTKLNCKGPEMSIANCSNLQWGNGFSHSDDVGVSCRMAWPPRLTVKSLSNCSAVLNINHTRFFGYGEKNEMKLIKAYEIRINKIGSTSSLVLLAERFSEFTIGDGKNYTGHHNKPLEPGTTYTITIRAVTKAQNGGSGYGEPVSKTFTTSRDCSGQPSPAYRQRLSILLAIVSVWWHLIT